MTDMFGRWFRSSGVRPPKKAARPGLSLEYLEDRFAPAGGTTDAMTYSTVGPYGQTSNPGVSNNSGSYAYYNNGYPNGYQLTGGQMSRTQLDAILNNGLASQQGSQVANSIMAYANALVQAEVLLAADAVVTRLDQSLGKDTTQLAVEGGMLQAAVNSNPLIMTSDGQLLATFAYNEAYGLFSGMI
jgi:hypothetical protein